MYTDMEWWTKIRLEVLRGESSKREILRREGVHWKTLAKILKYPELPGYRMKRSRPKPKIGAYLEQIAQIIESDKSQPKKQRHTAKRIYERIKESGYQGGYTQVREAVRDIKRCKKEVFMPLVHNPGEAQVDFGYALAKIAGFLKKVAFFVMALPHSDAFFVMGFERECTESYWEGHSRAFEFFGGVPCRISYDNSRVMVSMCRDDMGRRLRGKSGTKAELIVEDRQVFLPLPPSPFDACRKQPTRANSLSLVRFDDNDYSVPVVYAHHEILIKGYVDRVVLCHGPRVVAEHKRSWGKEGVFFNYLHYLPLLERKPGSLDYARPLSGFDLPECFHLLRRRLIAEQPKEGGGIREFIKVLRLLEDYPMDRVKRAVEKGLGMRVHSRDAIAQFIVPRPYTTFVLDGRDHLCLVKVGAPDVTAYQILLSEGGAL